MEELGEGEPKQQSPTCSHGDHSSPVEEINLLNLASPTFHLQVATVAHPISTGKGDPMRPPAMDGSIKDCKIFQNREATIFASLCLPWVAPHHLYQSTQKAPIYKTLSLQTVGECSARVQPEVKIAMPTYLCRMSSSTTIAPHRPTSSFRSHGVTPDHGGCLAGVRPHAMRERKRKRWGF
ncbi:hypothetical protein TIFTF001_012161 [Ficus carica]|uniref:Uncharacterized protein n=1 Tax=Ficus carica TaxID=3494 RepID=A0AA88A1V6_FICCA|nr:hypothetical protein TIFTF001_012161 [Ficus carica]